MDIFWNYTMKYYSSCCFHYCLNIDLSLFLYTCMIAVLIRLVYSVDI